MGYTRLTAWKMTSDRAVPEILLDAGVTKSRETETRRYEAYFSPASDLPASPINPGALSPTGWQQSGTGWTRVGSWLGLERGWDIPYESPGPKKYTETWQKVGAWQTVDN